jgi:peptidyl-prolyl cis-trans isomerase A (cyclophilin A)
LRPNDFVRATLRVVVRDRGFRRDHAADFPLTHPPSARFRHDARLAALAAISRGRAMNISRLLTLLLAGILALPSAATAGTIVQFDTNLGAFDVELFEATMPGTVANFLTYVTSNRYDSTIIHRSTTYNPADIQIVQGGGVLLSGGQLFAVATDPAIALETGHQNLRGTIAMARGTAPDSATSQWYLNVTDNPALDGGYAVFGQITDSAGLAVLDAIAGVPVYDASGAIGSPMFAELPLTSPSLDPSTLVLVTSVTAVAAVPEPSTYALAAAGLAAAAVIRRRRRN